MYSITDLKKMHECCSHHLRDWHETDNWSLPPSEHSPKCENYKTEIFAGISVKGEKWPSAVVEQGDVNDFTDGGEDEYDIRQMRMTRDQFEALHDFNGF